MGRLYVVATPIGNLEDITIRAIKILLNVPVIACEDTRRTGQLIKILKEKYADSFLNFKFPIFKKYISVRDWNEAWKVQEVLMWMAKGDVALVSDAGTPLLSDPGFKVTRAARKAGYAVIPIPGPFAAAAALSVAGLPTNKVVFWGFLPKNYDLADKATNVIYESPVRASNTLNEIKKRYPGSEIVVARELTKIHEYIGEDDGKTKKGEVIILVYLNRG
jgi:16S rRNA (cytidine1402-2'-O)-methyltransferase